MTLPKAPPWITSLGKDITEETLPRAPFRYLLLMTVPLQNWAYRPVPQEGEYRPAYAPGVLDLVKEFDPLPWHAWVWQGTPLDEQYDRGPLLVDATNQPSLMQHAFTHWAPAGDAMFIGSAADLSDMSAHLSRLVQLDLSCEGEATLDVQPHHLATWLEALDDDHRAAWLGPIGTLLWRATWGPAYDWRRLDRDASGYVGGKTVPLTLRPHELARFDANTREHFVQSRVYEVHSIPDHSGRSLEEIRRWVEQLLQLGDRLNFHDEAVAAQYISLLAHDPWLLQSDEARGILNDLTESPQARLRQLESLVRARGAPRG
ncbi:DUF4123 domain-containing protein [Achromobacter animicus]|uniref:DUF4123 domain-containing protein n=1 Tax=Achromobacter animicus TaxID=1389935 RepID=UPI001466E21A|nr:DUF4123 domain-containing protein [Achromobacter animicus]CAB3866057.1 hypothetical protein LMG26691_02739 [Achromobacter animicus]